MRDTIRLMLCVCDKIIRLLLTVCDKRDYSNDSVGIPTWCNYSTDVVYQCPVRIVRVDGIFKNSTVRRIGRITFPTEYCIIHLTNGNGFVVTTSEISVMVSLMVTVSLWQPLKSPWWSHQNADNNHGDLHRFTATYGTHVCLSSLPVCSDTCFFAYISHGSPCLTSRWKLNY